MIKLFPNEYEKYFENVIKTSGCWIWTGAFFPETGYGSFYLKWTKNSFGAHRIAFYIANGYLTKGLLIRHICNNRACVNPTHLIEGTQKDNMQDMVKAGRALTGKKNPSITHKHRLARGKDNSYYKYDYVKIALRAGHKKWVESGGNIGSKNSCAKLTEIEVLQIRQDYENKKFTRRQLSEQYKTSINNIRQIVLRIKWKHI